MILFIKYVVMGIIGFVSLYMLIPSIVARLTGIKSFRKGKNKNQVALTFDDGPHPIYTPALLDLLQEHQVKATFFVLGSQAERYPELINRMHREGHQIGIHNYNHTANWLMLPRTVRHDHLERTGDIIESIIGLRPKYYRPPWGLIQTVPNCALVPNGGRLAKQGLPQETDDQDSEWNGGWIGYLAS